MFGYVVINKPELKIKDYDKYQEYYCGLCQSLKQNHGRRGQLTLNYDLNFVGILLSSLYEPTDKQYLIPVSYTHLDVYKRQTKDILTIKIISTLNHINRFGFFFKRFFKNLDSIQIFINASSKIITCSLRRCV